MSKIVLGAHGNQSVGVDLDALLTTRLLIQANSGAGKSWLLRVLMEQLFGRVQVIAIDPEGEFATLREKFDYALVGNGGEIPADVRIAGEVAEKLLELRVSAVCDLYELRAQERHTWVARFLSALVDAPKTLWHPVVVVVDEAHMFCPEKSAGESEAAGPMVDLCTRGRKRGFCPVWATQRLANVSKQATAMLLNRLVGGTFEDVDIKRALELLSVNPEDKREFSQSLKTLEPGWFYAFGRAIAKERVLFRVGAVQTSHPKPGSSKHAAGPPPPPEKIRSILARLSEIPHQAEEKARTVTDLKKQITELRNQLAAAQRAKAPSAAPDQGAIKRALEAEVQRELRDWRRFTRELDERLRRVSSLVAAKLGDIPAEVAPAPVRPLPDLPRAEVPSRAVARPHQNADSVAASNGLSGSQRRILLSIAEWEALGRTAIAKTTLAALCEASSTSSTYGNNLGALRSRGLIQYPQPGTVAFTDAGRAAAPAGGNPPRSPSEMLDRCSRIVSGSQARILAALAERYPAAVFKPDLAAIVGASSSSSTYGNNLGALRTAGFIDYPAPGAVRIEPWVMLDDDR